MVRLRVRQRPQQHRVHHAEDGGVRSNAESERENRHGGEARIALKLPQAVTEVLQEIFEVIDLAHVTALLFDLVFAAQLAQGGVARFLRGHSHGGLFLHQFLKVKAKFVGKLTLDAALPEKRTESKRHFVKPAHNQRFSIVRPR
jgi:hypothetical protein